MSDFTEQPVYNGVGDYHFNRYRVVFKCPPAETKQSLARDFVANFPAYLTSPYATVVKGERNFGSRPTFHFHGFKMVPFPSAVPLRSPPTIDIARPHTDWVAKIDENDNLGFTAQTLKREFMVVSEDGPTGFGVLSIPGVSPLINLLAAGDPMEVNRMHFLAGRRSWRLDDGKSFEVDGDVLVLETIAVERFSHKAYMRADALLGLEKAVPDIWIAMLNNFITKRTLVRVPQRLRPGWMNKNGIDYYIKSFDDEAALSGDIEFAQQKRLGLFKTILPSRK
jgi:hypothetical protein